MKRRIICFLMALCIVSLAACGKKADQETKAPAQAPAAQEHSAGPEGPRDGAKSPAGAADAAQTQAAAQQAPAVQAPAADPAEIKLLEEGRIPVQVSGHRLELPGTAEDGVELLSYVRFQEIRLTPAAGEEYPALSKALDAYSDWRGASMESLFGRLGADAAAALKEGWMTRAYFEPFCSTTDTEILRADRRIFSYFVLCGDYAGGAHPNSAYEAHVIDPQTGRELLLSDVVSSAQGLADLIFAEIRETEEERADALGEEQLSALRGLVQGNLLTFGLSEEGMHAYISPYEIGPYALGGFDVLLPYEKYPELFRAEYIPEDAAGEAADAVTEAPEEKQEFTAEQAYAMAAEEGPEHYVTFTVKNPDLEEKQEDENAGEEESAGEEVPGEEEIAAAEDATEENSAEDAAQEDGEEPKSVLEEISHETGGVLDAQAWAADNGVPLPAQLPYTDGAFRYRDYGDGSYGYITLEVTEQGPGGRTVYFDLSEFAEDKETARGRKNQTGQHVIYAAARDGILYAALGHDNYAAYAPNTGYVLAIDMSDGKLLWRSQRQVSNAHNFILREDCIICGYGFTNEPDFIYVLDRGTGALRETVKLPNAPYHFLEDGDELTVLTYNSVYRYTMHE